MDITNPSISQLIVFTMFPQAKGIADDLYEEYSSLKSKIYAYRYTNSTQSDRDNLVNRIKSFIESNSEIQQKTLNEKGDIEGLQLFFEVLFEFKVALEMMSISDEPEQQSVIIIGCVISLLYHSKFIKRFIVVVALFAACS